ncbi:hypothetical protein C0992_002700 [Termitomyces sp. T32_za158]|nr:hypothetical protein C0992_002700 [Termitomyces sp. T32_za158]
MFSPCILALASATRVFKYLETLQSTVSERYVPMSQEKEAHSHDEKAIVEFHETATFDFGGDSTLPSPPKLTEAQEEKLYSKIDARLMPILALLYLLSFIDRGKFLFLLALSVHDLIFSIKATLACRIYL